MHSNRRGARPLHRQPVGLVSRWCAGSAGNKRRKEGAAGVDANFFSASNRNAQANRERMAMETLEELLAWVQDETRGGGCACGIFDATNTTVARREKVRQRIALERPYVKLIFVELICNDEALLEANYRMKLSNDDYKGADPEAALADFKERVRQYELVYEHVDDEVECRALTLALALPLPLALTLTLTLTLGPAFIAWENITWLGSWV